MVLGVNHLLVHAVLQIFKDGRDGVAHMSFTPDALHVLQNDHSGSLVPHVVQAIKQRHPTVLQVSQT